MGEFFHWLTETPEGGAYAAALLIGGIGAYFYVMNWAIFFNNLNPKKKWSSMVPPLGGFLIALAFLLFIPAPWKWLALIGATDPCIGVIIYSIAKGAFGKAPENQKDKEETDENGKHSD
ncbi:MAG: hypothetical protein IJU82_09300 [Ruminiclostridium sp.]|nr:hypothetical protein [Ruminiclostridium sp.]